jgi:hypothetical protein
MEFRVTLVAAMITIILIIIPIVAGLCGKSSIWFYGTFLAEIIAFLFIVNKSHKARENSLKT